MMASNLQPKSLGGGPIRDVEEGLGNLSQIQYVLKLAHSPELTDQQKAAIELSRLVEGSKFPALSFGPLAHALCKLLPSQNRTVAFHAARAVKILLLDDALRGQALVVGIPAVLVAAMRAWEEEVPCLKEILAGLQTLTWDKYAILQVADAFPPLLVLLQSRDQELCLLVTAVLANALAYSDTLFLSRMEFVNNMANALPRILELAKSQDRLQRCYATAAIANASAHPVLAGKIKELDGLTVIQQIESQNKRNLNFGGTRTSEAVETAIARLSGESATTEAAKGELDPRAGLKKYSFKWGNEPVMVLTLDSQGNRVKLVVCLAVWVAFIYYIMQPILLTGGSPKIVR